MYKDGKFEILRTSVAILVAILISFSLIILVSDAPFEALKDLFLGPLSSKRRLGNVIELAIPLMMAGVAVTIIFSSGFINLGAEGAFFFGGFTSAMVAIGVPLPPYLHFFIAALLAGFVGAIIVATPVFLKEKTGASEIVTSLMMNYILLFLGTYLLYYHFKDPKAGLNESYLFPDSFPLSTIIRGTKIHTGIFISLLAVLFSFCFLYRMSMGYKIRMVGENREFARYSGIKIFRVAMASQLVGGFFAGLGGALQVGGMYTRYKWVALPGYGWDGIIISILARNNPIFIPLAAFFIAYIRTGADIMARGNSGVPTELVSITQGVIIILIVARQFLAGYRNKTLYKEIKKRESKIKSDEVLSI